MKKVFFTLSLMMLIGSAMLTSCSSEKDCECTTTVAGVESGTTTTTIEDGDCEDLNSTVTTAGITSSTECVEQ